MLFCPPPPSCFITCTPPRSMLLLPPPPPFHLLYHPLPPRLMHLCIKSLMWVLRKDYTTIAKYHNFIPKCNCAHQNFQLWRYWLLWHYQLDGQRIISQCCDIREFSIAVNVPLVNVVERMSARNVGSTAHMSSFTDRRTIKNCLMSARNMRAAAHAPCSQRALSMFTAQILNAKSTDFTLFTDRWRRWRWLVDGGGGAVTYLCSAHWSLQSAVPLRSLHNQKTRHSCHGHYSFLSRHTSGY